MASARARSASSMRPTSSARSASDSSAAAVRSSRAAVSSASACSRAPMRSSSSSPRAVVSSVRVCSRRVRRSSSSSPSAELSSARLASRRTMRSRSSSAVAELSSESVFSRFVRRSSSSSPSVELSSARLCLEANDALAQLLGGRGALLGERLLQVREPLQQLRALGGILGEALLEPGEALQQLRALGGILGEALLQAGEALQQLGALGGILGEALLQAAQPAEQLLALGGVLRRALLQAADALEQQLALGGVLGRADLVADALELLARLVDLLLGLLGAVAAGLRLAAGLLERDRQVGGGLLQVLDALQRGQQAGDDGGGVVEVGDRVALDAGIGIEALLALDVLCGARGLAGGERLLDPRRRLRRAERDERARRAPAVPRLGLGLERLAHRAHHDRVLLAHAHQHQVARQLEGEVLEEEREVEALVELDRDEDHLEREAALVDRVDRADRLRGGGARGLAALEEALPRLGLGGRVVDERVEQALAQHLGGVEPEQQLGRLTPLRDRSLPVREDEEPVDDLREEVVERVVVTRLLVDVRVLRSCLDGVHRGSRLEALSARESRRLSVHVQASPRGARRRHGNPQPSHPRIGAPASL